MVDWAPHPHRLSHQMGRARSCVRPHHHECSSSVPTNAGHYDWWGLNGGDLAATFIPNMGDQACTPIHSALCLSYATVLGLFGDFQFPHTIRRSDSDVWHTLTLNARSFTLSPNPVKESRSGVIRTSIHVFIFWTYRRNRYEYVEKPPPSSERDAVMFCGGTLIRSQCVFSPPLWKFYMAPPCPLSE